MSTAPMAALPCSATAARPCLRGIERADSISLDAHKWLYQPFEAGCVMVKDVAHLVRAFSVNPDYLQDTKLGLEHVNFADRGYQLTRSFRALKVWMSIQTFGLAALSRGDRAHDPVCVRCRCARRRTRKISSSWVRLRSACCASATGRGAPAGRRQRIDALNEAIQARVIQSGTAMISSTRLRGTYSLRLCIMSHQTTWDDVTGTIRRIEDFGRALSAA